MIYEVTQAQQGRRYFSRQTLYSQIDWSNLDQIVDAYRQRIQDWYLDPAKKLAKNVHFAFSVMALNCLLIDTLSQFVVGLDSSDHREFKAFIRGRLPSAWSRKLTTPIRHDDGKKKQKLLDVADVLYHGFRCGILHQAHIPPYGGVVPGGNSRVQESSPGLVKYRDSGLACPSVILNPLLLLDDLETAFEAYLAELKDRRRKNDVLREDFKQKFSTSFGVDVSAAR